MEKVASTTMVSNSSGKCQLVCFNCGMKQRGVKRRYPLKRSAIPSHLTFDCQGRRSMRRMDLAKASSLSGEHRLSPKWLQLSLHPLPLTLAGLLFLQAQKTKKEKEKNKRKELAKSLLQKSESVASPQRAVPPSAWKTFWRGISFLNELLSFHIMTLYWGSWKDPNPFSPQAAPTFPFSNPKVPFRLTALLKYNQQKSDAAYLPYPFCKRFHSLS